MLIAFTAVLFIISSSWTTDLMIHWVRHPELVGHWLEWLIAPMLLMASLVLAYVLSTRFQYVDILKPKAQIKSKKALILSVSNTNRFDFLREGDKASLKFMSRNGDDQAPIPLTADLQRDYSTLDKVSRWNWTPLLRAIEPHKQSLKEIRLLVSSGEGGSHSQAGDLARLLAFYLPDVHIESLPSVSFAEPDDVLFAIRKAIEDLRQSGYQEKDIVIDITGGTKTATIGGALATLYHPSASFQYVLTEGNKSVLSYNVTATTRDNLGTML